jgi:hypothetical protein
MSDTDRAFILGANTVVDKKFNEYMKYVAEADLTKIQNCMKRNLGKIRSKQYIRIDRKPLESVERIPQGFHVAVWQALRLSIQEDIIRYG